MKKQSVLNNSRAEDSEKKLKELQKKCDDYKRAYSDTKNNLNKAMSDLEKLKKPSGQEPSEQEFKEKYEHLKVKYRVSKNFNSKNAHHACQSFFIAVK